MSPAFQVGALRETPTQESLRETRLQSCCEGQLGRAERALGELSGEVDRLRSAVRERVERRRGRAKES